MTQSENDHASPKSPPSRFPRRLFWAALAVVTIGLIILFMMRSRDRRTAGQQVPRSQLVSMDVLKHDLWTSLLQKFVDDQGQVDYRSWSTDSESLEQLQGYLRLLSAANPDFEASKAARIAFWINAYNALTIHGILQEYPTTSIRNHTSLLGGYNIWYDLKLLVGDQEYSLNDIEHQILRKMDEPRIHFAIVCASKSCPRLLNQAYSASSLDKQLNTNALHFFANSENCRVSEDGKTLYLSSILNWFQKDFGANQAEMLESIQPYFPRALSERIKNLPIIRYLQYDWSLNGR